MMRYNNKPIANYGAKVQLNKLPAVFYILYFIFPLVSNPAKAGLACLPQAGSPLPRDCIAWPVIMQ